MEQKYCGCYYQIHYGIANSWDHQLMRRWLPRISTEAYAEISINAVRVTLKQIYKNPSAHDSIDELRYSFPLYDGVSIVGCDFQVDERTINGIVKERLDARATYDAAVERGKTAALLEQLPQASDEFTMSIGNLPAGATVVAQITYIGELKHDAEVDGIRFTIPTSIAPRYGGNQPPSLANPSCIDSSIRITVDVSMPLGKNISKLVSPSHPVSVALGTISTASDDEPLLSRASASLALGSSDLEKDFALQIVLGKNNGTPMAVLERHPTLANQQALMLTFVPRFALKPIHPEIVFVADRSGSMSANIGTLRSALQVFLKSLPVGIKFNICSFGTSYSFLWPKSITYSQAAVEEALAMVATFEANLGGTETENAIRATFERRLEDLPLECLLLTDGDIWNQQDLFQYLNKETKKSQGAIRVFSLGLGDGVSHALIEGVARAGGGFAQTVQLGEQLSGKVIRMLKGALSPHISDISLELDTAATTLVGADDFEMISDEFAGPERTTRKMSLFDTEADTTSSPRTEGSKTRFSHLPHVPPLQVLQAPFKIQQLYPINRVNIYMLLSPHSISKAPRHVTLRGMSPQGPLELQIPVELLAEPGLTVHQLAARKAVQELEEGRGWIQDAKDSHGTLLSEMCPSRMDELAEREGIAIGLQYQIASKWTSFVAVDGQTGKEEASRQFAIREKDEAVNMSARMQHHMPLMRGTRHLALARPTGFGQPSPPPAPMAMSAPPPVPRLGSISAREATGYPPGHTIAQPPGAIPYAVTLASLPATRPSGAFRGTNIGVTSMYPDSTSLSASQQPGSSLHFSTREPPLSRLRSAASSVDAASASSSLIGASPSVSSFGVGYQQTDRSFFQTVRAKCVTIEKSGKSQSKSDSASLGQKKPQVQRQRQQKLQRQQQMRQQQMQQQDPPMMCAMMTSTESPQVSQTSAYAQIAHADNDQRNTLLYTIINVQSFDGPWKTKDVPLVVLRHMCSAVLKAQEFLVQAGKYVSDEVLGTGLVVAYMEMELAADRDVWELVVDKARGWLVTQIGDQTVDDLISLCKSSMSD